MVDTSSLASLIASFPQIPQLLTGPLMMDRLANKAIPKTVQRLGRRGLVGFLPIGQIENSYFTTLRVLPEVPLAACAGVEVQSIVELLPVLTFAPRLDRFVAGRLAWLDIAAPEHNWERGRLDGLAQVAAELGDQEATPRLLAALPKICKEPDSWRRRSLLYTAADPREPLFRALAGAKGAATWADAARWADDHVAELGDVQLVRSIQVATHSVFKIAGDTTASAWAMVLGDAIADHYDGLTPMPIGFNWERSPLAFAARTLAQAGVGRLSGERAALWPAAQAFAKKPNRYQGEAHLEAAASLRKREPRLAWKHASNAAYFRATNSRRVPKKEIAFLQDLAEERGWTELATLAGFVG